MLDTLPLYKSHKTVRAAPMLWLSGELAGAFKVMLEVDGERVEVSVPMETFARGRPQAGDYIVLYDGGYVSWSPKAAFTAGYTREDDGERPKQKSETYEKIRRLMDADRERREWRLTDFQALFAAMLVPVNVMEIERALATMVEEKSLKLVRNRDKSVSYRVVR